MFIVLITPTSLPKITQLLSLQKATLAIACLVSSIFSDMARSVPLVSSVFVLLLLLMATEMGPMVAEARTCESQSHRFRGPCVRSSNCGSVCQTEGFPGGHCRGFRRRCFCSKPC